MQRKPAPMQEIVRSFANNTVVTNQHRGRRTSTVSRINWGIISTGRIAGVFAKGLAESQTGRLLAVGSRSQESADRFGDEFGAERRYSTYEALLQDPDVQAVYIATPHPQHAQWAIRAARAGKHILCEKPMTINHAEAMAVAWEARQAGVLLMEAFMYRCHPQTARLAELIREGAVGNVRMIEAHFGFRAGEDPASRLFAPELGGGGILDVGCYAVSMARLIAGAALGQPFANPVQVEAVGHLGGSGIDYWSAALLRFPEEIVAQVSTSVTCHLGGGARVAGDAGVLTIPSPWFCDGQIIWTRPGQPDEVLQVTSDRGSYALEADILAASIETGDIPPPAAGPDDMLGNMQTLDAWRSRIGLLYPSEQPGAALQPVSGLPLTRRPSAPIPSGSVAGIPIPVSRLVLGAMTPRVPGAEAHMGAIFDAFYELGGNTFDTAWIYGASDGLLGRWVASRGVRDSVCILAKGAHTPLCDPGNLEQQLRESVDRMGTHADLYMMHRDNLEIPVGEFVDVMDRLADEGLMRAYGVSNWTTNRIDEANAWAQAHGRRRIAAISNNLSLARMVDPVWAGCIGMNNPESLGWLQASGIPLFSWSSQARGFFARADADRRDDPELVRCWYAPDNFERLARARKLAAELNVSATAIAAAWLLNQPFQTHALIGPANLQELDDTVSALSLQLSTEQMRWLNLHD